MTFTNAPVYMPSVPTDPLKALPTINSDTKGIQRGISTNHLLNLH